MIKPLSVSPDAGSEVRFQAYINALSEEIGHADLIRALENEQDDRAKVNGFFGSLNDWKG